MCCFSAGRAGAAPRLQVAVKRGHRGSIHGNPVYAHNLAVLGELTVLALYSTQSKDCRVLKDCLALFGPKVALAEAQGTLWARIEALAPWVLNPEVCQQTDGTLGGEVQLVKQNVCKWKRAWAQQCLTKLSLCACACVNVFVNVRACGSGGAQPG
eukprot:1160505-Pelagomonas_calceolata.AAC.2